MRARGDACLARALALTIWLTVLPASPALAQSPHPLTIEGGAAWFGFADDVVVSEAAAIGAARVSLGPRLSVGPEVTFISGEDHSHLVATGNLTWDLRPTATVQPFLVVGGGLYQTRQRFRSGTFTSREGAFTAGGGVRVRVSPRVTVGVDARVGWELHTRVAGMLGLRLGAN